MLVNKLQFIHVCMISQETFKTDVEISLGYDVMC